MTEPKPQYIHVDLKRNTQYDVPTVTQNDTARRIIVKVTDDGIGDPELLDAYQEITMTSERPDGQSFYIRGTRIPDTNEVEFHLGTDETSIPGNVKASLQFYLVEDASRYTSAQFRYEVDRDLAKNYKETKREETLVEVVLRDGPVAIQEAKDAKIAVDGALVELEQDKTAAIDRLDEVTEENKTVFRQPVNTFADLATTYPNPEHGTTVRVTSESASYRFSDGTWVKTDEYNPTAIDQVTAQLADKANQEEVEILRTTKADATLVSRSLDSKRDKTKPIGVNDFDAETLGIIQDGTGGTPVEVLSIPRDNSVSPGKTTFIYEDQQNLFNPQNATDGVRTNADGTLLNDANFYTSDFIPVEAGKTYFFIAHGITTTTGRIIAYDANQDFLKVLSSGLSISLSGAQITVDFDGYIRVPFANSVSKSIVQIVDIAIYNGSYTPYKMTLDEKITVSMDALPEGAVSHRLIANESVESVNIGQGEVDFSYHASYTPLVFPDRQVNLFNKDTVTQDVYIAQANGTETANTAYTGSDFIRVRPGASYAVVYRNQGAWYDRDRNYLTGIPNATETTFTAPDGAYFMRMSVRKENVGSQMIVEGTTVPASYQEHFQVKSRGIIEAMEAIRTQNRLTTPEEIARPLLFSGSGKIKLLGDSRTHGSRGTGFAQDGEIIPGTTDVRTSPNSHSWGNSLRDLLEWKYGITVVNYGIAGANSLTIKNIMSSVIESDDDLIIMQLGTNDRHNFPSPESLKMYQRDIINYAYSLGIPVILMSAPPVAVENDNEEIRNFGMYDVDKALRELAEEYRMRPISNYDGTLKYCEYRGVTPDALLADGLHENDDGYDVVFRNVVRSLGISYAREGVTT